MFYYNYRYYDVELGRWLSRDPIGEFAGKEKKFNLLYGFVNNDAVIAFDDKGLRCRKNTCKKWTLNGALAVYSVGFIVNVVGGHIGLWPDYNCCMDERRRTYKYMGIVAGMSLKLPGSMTGSDVSVELKSDVCLGWDDFHGWGNINSIGGGLGITYGGMGMTIPNFGYREFWGFGKGFDASIISGPIRWWTEKDPY